MNLKQLIIAFLSPRYPAAYTEAAIAQRLNASQMLDKRCTVALLVAAVMDAQIIVALLFELDAYIQDAFLRFVHLCQVVGKYILRLQALELCFHRDAGLVRQEMPWRLILRLLHRLGNGERCTEDHGDQRISAHQDTNNDNQPLTPVVIQKPQNQQQHTAAKCHYACDSQHDE